MNWNILAHFKAFITFIKKAFLKQPMWSKLGALFVAYAMSAFFILPVVFVFTFSVLIGEVNSCIPAMLRLDQYAILTGLVSTIFKTYADFYIVNSSVPPMPLEWQLKHFLFLLGQQGTLLLPFFAVILAHNVLFTRFKYIAGKLLNRHDAYRYMNATQLLVDLLLLGILIISASFCNGGGTSAVHFLWSVITFCGLIGFGTISTWLRNHDRREAN